MNKDVFNFLLNTKSSDSRFSSSLILFRNKIPREINGSLPNSVHELLVL